MRIVITDANERATLAAVRSLGRDHEVHVTGSGLRSLAGASRFSAGQHRVPSPLADSRIYADEMSELTRRIKADVLIPVSDASCRVLLPESARLAPTRIAGPGPRPYAALSDKLGILALADRHGIGIPPSETVSSLKDAIMAAERLGWPVVLKPRGSIVLDEKGRARKVAVVRAADQRSLDAAWHSWAAGGPAVVQKDVPGRGEGVFLLRWSGRTLAVFAHRRLREKPPGGGVSVLRESIVADRELVSRLESLLDQVGFDGVMMAEFRNDGRQRWLIEFNARFWGSLQLAIDAGVDFPGLLVDAVRGEVARPVSSYALGVRSRWLLGEFDHAIALVRGHVDADGRRGLWAAARVLLSGNGPGTRFEVLRPGDPLPFVHEASEWIRAPFRYQGAP